MGERKNSISLFTYLILVGDEVRYVHSEELKPDVTKLVCILPLKGCIKKVVLNKFKVNLKDLEFDTTNSFDSKDLEKSNLETVVGHSINLPSSVLEAQKIQISEDKIKQPNRVCRPPNKLDL